MTRSMVRVHRRPPKIMHLFSGLIGVVIGVLLVRYAFVLTNTFGTVEWAERHLRGGLAGTYSLYKIAGVVIIILSLLYMFGLIGMVLGPLANVFGGVKNAQQ